MFRVDDFGASCDRFIIAQVLVVIVGMGNVILFDDLRTVIWSGNLETLLCSSDRFDGFAFFYKKNNKKIMATLAKQYRDHDVTKTLLRRHFNVLTSL